MVEMKWQDPPPAVSGEKAAVLAELQKHPGRWALVGRNMASTSATSPWKKLGCESVYRKAESVGGAARYDVYARWPERKPSGVTVNPPRHPSSGVYDPTGRAARGVPEDGLPAASLRR